jgi:hypothetical protein
MHASTRLELTIIQNPAEELQPEERVEQVRYIVSVEEVRGKGIRV